MFKRFPIRRKLALALVLPLVVANAVSFFEAYRSRQAAQHATRDANLATAPLGPDGVVTGLRLESSVTAVVVIGLPPSVLGQGSLAAERAKVDSAVSRVAPFIRSHGAAAVAAYQPVLQALGRISSLRSEVDAFQGPKNLTSPPAVALATKVVNQYDAVIQTVLDANTTLTLGIGDPVLRNGAELLDADARSSQYSGALTTAIGGIVESGKPATSQQLTDIADANGRFENTQLRVSQLATGTFASAAPRSQAPFEQIIQQVLTGQKVNVQQLVSGALGNGSKDPSNVGTVNTAAAIVTARAAKLRRDAQHREYEYEALAVAALLMAFASAMIAGRSIARPLRRLTEDAEQMAGVRLPATVQEILAAPLTVDVPRPAVEPITARTRDEVADLAVALNTVQARAVDLAVEQAEQRRRSAQSFVDLGRRNQNLIGRQLDFITELEQRETDPETLDNLFRLDHLATRMRRNAASLLVLAGQEASRQWSAPVPLSDVVRAALGEVEDYKRVNVREMRGVMVSGSSSGDLVHLVAELLENALSYSAPGSPVEIMGRRLPDGFALSIMDEGLGMSPAERDAANARLSRARAPDGGAVPTSRPPGRRRRGGPPRDLGQPAGGSHGRDRGAAHLAGVGSGARARRQRRGYGPGPARDGWPDRQARSPGRSSSPARRAGRARPGDGRRRRRAGRCRSRCRPGSWA